MTGSKKNHDREVKPVIRDMNSQAAVIINASDLSALRRETPTIRLTIRSEALGEAAPTTNSGKQENDSAPHPHEQEREKREEDRG